MPHNAYPRQKSKVERIVKAVEYKANDCLRDVWVEIEEEAARKIERKVRWRQRNRFLASNGRRHVGGKWRLES
jgi:hypothetical protein